MPFSIGRHQLIETLGQLESAGVVIEIVKLEIAVLAAQTIGNAGGHRMTATTADYELHGETPQWLAEARMKRSEDV